MNGPTDDLLRRMLAEIAGQAGHAAAAGLIAKARADAEQEVAALLKSAFKASLLHRVVEELEGGRDEQVPATEADGPEPQQPVDVPAPPAGAGCYVYAITPAVPSPPVLSEQGVDPSFPVEALRVDDLQAIVSPVSLDEFGQAALNERVADPQWVEAKVRAHDRVVKSALATGSVIPFRFCTVVRSPDDVRDLLTRHHDRVTATLAELAGKSEWGVKVYAAPTDAGGDEPESGEASGAAYLRRKSRAGEEQRESLQAAHGRAAALHEELTAIARGAVTLPAHRRRGEEGRPLVLNVAYLVADADLERFHAAVAAGAEGLSVEVTGPWPPYNFAHLDLSTEVAA